MSQTQETSDKTQGKRIFYFHYPEISAELNGRRRYTVAFTLEKTKTTKDQDEWLLSYGATIFKPPTKEDKDEVTRQFDIKRRCQKCKENRGFCGDCRPIHEQLKKKLHEFTWHKRIHARTARERLLNNPVQFVLYSENGAAMHYYQFRRLEKFILKRIHYFGVSNVETDLTVGCDAPVATYAELGYEILDQNLTQAEKKDLDNYNARMAQENLENLENLYNQHQQHVYHITTCQAPGGVAHPAVVISLETVLTMFAVFSVYQLSTVFMKVFT